MRKCTSCYKCLNDDCFYRYDRNGGLRSKCKACCNDMSKKYKDKIRHLYHHAKTRCKSGPSYVRRGILFKFNTFEEFKKELGERLSPEHSVDRIDNNGHYEPGNIRWATKREQAFNRCDNVDMEFFNSIREYYLSNPKLSIRQVCDKFCIYRSTLRKRFRGLYEEKLNLYNCTSVYELRRKKGKINLRKTSPSKSVRKTTK